MCLKEAVTLWRAHTGTGSCQQLRRGAHAGAGLLAGPVAPWEVPHAGVEEEHEEEGAAETTCDELTATPAPCPLRCAGGGGGEVRSEDEPRKKREGWGEGVF